MEIDKAIEFMYQKAHEAHEEFDKFAKNNQRDKAFECLTQAEDWVQIADWLTELEGYKETEIKAKEKFNKLGQCLRNYLKNAHTNPNDGFDPIEGHCDTFYDGVLWAFGKLVQLGDD